MTIDRLVIENLLPELIQYGFVVVSQYENHIRLKSESVEVTISYNKLDRTSMLEIGKSDQFLYPLNDSVIREMFGIDLKIDNVTKEDFVNNLILFFHSEGGVLLRGDEVKLDELKKFIERESEVYMAKITNEQILIAANKAWEQGNYREYIRVIDQMNKEELPSSYQLKYVFAVKRI